LASVAVLALTLGLAACDKPPENTTLENGSGKPLVPGLYLNNVSASESAGELKFQVRLVPANSQDITFYYSLVTEAQARQAAKDAGVNVDVLDIDVAEFGSDFDAFEGSRAFTIPAGTTDASIRVGIKPDTVYEHDEYLALNISDASGGVTIRRAAAYGKIINDDPVPVASISLGDADPVTEAGNGSSHPLLITLSGDTEVPARVMVVQSGGEADYASEGYGFANAVDDFQVIRKEIRKEINYKAPGGPKETVLPGVTLRLVESSDVIDLNGIGTVIDVERNDNDEIVKETLLAGVEGYSLDIIDDGLVETKPEMIFIKLVALNGDVAVPASGATLFNTNVGATVLYVISDNDVIPEVQPLNDTGVTSRLTLNDNTLPHQDADFGRDANGGPGFDLVKISATGEELPPEASQWSCVLDRTSNLIWEVKATNTHSEPASQGINALTAEKDMIYHGADRLFNWHMSDPSLNGGVAGWQGTGICDIASSNTGCKTSEAEAYFNKQKYCGVSGWRLPTFEELNEIASFEPGTGSLNTLYFPMAGEQSFGAHGYWTSQTVAGDASRAWVVVMRNSDIPITPYAQFPKTALGRYIRLVANKGGM